MGYSKTYEPDTISISDSVLCQVGTAGTEYHVNAGAYAKYLYFTVIKEVSPNIRLGLYLEYFATAPDEIYWQFRKNGVDVIGSGNWFGAWQSSTEDVLISGLKPGDTVELWAYGTTGVTASFRNWKVYGVITPFYASA